MEKIIDFVVKYKALIVGVVVILFIAMIASLGLMIYNSTLRIDQTEIAGVYGMNGKRNTKITFDDATTDAVLKAVEGMKYDGADKGDSARYQTYVCIEMTDGTKYQIKYCDASSVYIYGAARVGRYVNTSDADAMADILAIVKALEKKNGANTESTSSGAASSGAASSGAFESGVSSVAEGASQNVSVNSVEQ